MKLISFNCRGVASPSKKISLHRLVESSQPDILMLQETLGDSNLVVPLLENLFKGWNFIGLDAKGCSGGLAMGWRSRSIKLINSWGFELGLGMTVRVEDIGRNFTILNVYRPSQESMQYYGRIF
jgi:exonuclease III